MSYLPDTTEPIEEIRYESKIKTVNSYYQGLLNKEHKRVLEIYKYAVEDMANCFDNTEVWDNIIASLEEDDGTSVDDEISDIEQVIINRPNVARVLKLILLSWMDSRVNDYAISLTENELEEEFNKKRNKMEKDFQNLPEEEFKAKYPRIKTYIEEYGSYGYDPSFKKTKKEEDI